MGEEDEIGGANQRSSQAGLLGTGSAALEVIGAHVVGRASWALCKASFLLWFVHPHRFFFFG